MKVYIQGAVVVALILLAAVVYWVKYSDTLSVNRNPESFSLIKKLETEGAIDFELPRLDGSKIHLKDLAGKVVILNFWASWCNPCVQEFPSLVKLAEHFKGDIVILAVSNDENVKDVEDFIRAFGFPKPHFEIVVDHDREVTKKYGVEQLPESFLLNREQKLVRKVMGIDNWYTDNAIAFFNDLLGVSGQKLGQ